MTMPELKCCSIRCHIPGLGLRKASSFVLTAPDLRPTPQAIKTCTDKIQILNRLVVHCLNIIENVWATKSLFYPLIMCYIEEEQNTSYKLGCIMHLTRSGL